MSEGMNPTMEKLLESVKSVEKPAQVEREAPVEAPAGIPIPEPLAEINYPSGDLPPGGLVPPKKKRVLRPTAEEMARIQTGRGVVVEPELMAAIQEQAPPGRADGPTIASAYADTYWTHFDFDPPVRAAINRVQAQYPWLTYANTYYMHPPVYGRKYETVSMDLWGGGWWNGKYAGYRGKPIGYDLGWKCFNALFNDPNLPNIYWIIFNGYMWSRLGGWTSSPWGPAGSDARHDYHLHTSFLLWW